MPSSLTRPRGRTLQPTPATRALPRTSLGLVLSLSLLAGCNTFADPNRSFIDPGEVVRSGGETLYQNILERIDAAEDPRREFTAAQPPRPEDLNVPEGDYVLSKNDLLSIEIADLQGIGSQTVKTTRVS